MTSDHQGRDADRKQPQTSSTPNIPSLDRLILERLKASPLAAVFAGAMMCMSGFVVAKFTLPQNAGAGFENVNPNWYQGAPPPTNTNPMHNINPIDSIPAHGATDIESLFDSEEDFREYCRHVALATLASQHVESDDNEIRFFKDSTQTGSAVEQFADLFGQAIQTRRNPSSRSSSKPK